MRLPGSSRWKVSSHFAHELLDFVAELQCGESWENIPLEFHWLSVNCVQSSVSPFQDKTQNLKIHNLCMRETDDFFIIDQRYLFPCRIFLGDLRLNFSGMSNICFKVRSFPVFERNVKFLNNYFP